MSTFVQADYDFLYKEYEVISYHYKIGSHLWMKVRNIFSSLYIALRWIWKVDVVYCWFAGFHGFFPVLFANLFHKKSIVIVGGFDAVSIPSIKFGVFYKNNLLQWCVRKQYQWANYILLVDESLERSVNYYADPSGHGYPNGIRNFVQTDAKIVTIPFGYDSEKFRRTQHIDRRYDVISVGWTTTEQVFYRKGFDLVLEAAKILPEVSFVIVGMGKELQNKFKESITENVIVHEFQSHEQLINLLSLSKVFLQLSLSEGLPNTLCEAMLCECIPIGSEVNGIPKAIGDAGYILKEKNTEKVKDLINDALTLDTNCGSKARQRIIEMFPMQKRILDIKTIIEN